MHQSFVTTALPKSEQDGDIMCCVFTFKLVSTMPRKCRGLIDLDKIAVHYNNRLRGRTVMVLPGSCPHSMVVTIGNCRHKVKYVHKRIFFGSKDCTEEM